MGRTGGHLGNVPTIAIDNTGGAMMDGPWAVDLGLLELLHHIQLCIGADTPTVVVVAVVVVGVKQFVTGCSSQLLKEEVYL